MGSYSPIIRLKDLAIAAAEDDEEAEEALSLSGLVLNADETRKFVSQPRPKSPNSPIESAESDFFEFSNDFSSEMSHAEDIIFGGKLMPFSQRFHSGRLIDNPSQTDEKFGQFCRRISESMSERRPRRTNSARINVMRTSRSLDYKKLYGKSSSIRSETSPTAKRRWYFSVFGLLQFPPEMGLQDMKNRQVRRSMSGNSSFNASEKEPLKSDDRRCSSWNILRVLSCKDDQSVPVMESPACSRLQQA